MKITQLDVYIDGFFDAAPKPTTEQWAKLRQILQNVEVSNEIPKDVKIEPNVYTLGNSRCSLSGSRTIKTCQASCPGQTKTPESLEAG